jgi:hypothetical protein
MSLATGSPFDSFVVPAQNPDADGFKTDVDLIVSDDRVFIRFEQENEAHNGKEYVVLSQAKFLELAERMRNIQ